MLQQATSYQGNKPLLYIRSGIFFVHLVITSLLFSPFLLLAIAAPFEVRYRIAKQWVKLNLWAVKVVCGLHYTVEGLENIPAHENAIVLSKHQSAWETLSLYLIFPTQVILLKRELLWLPFWGWALATLKPIAINRKSKKAALRSLLEQGSQRLKEGFWVIIYPEGTRTAPGEVKKFNAGGSLLAERTQTPVIPVAHNAGEFWPRYSFLKYPGTIRVKIGPLISPAGRKANDINEEVRAWIENAMTEISGQTKQN